MIVLGIETSCDENSVAVVKDGRQILSSVVFSQVDLHKIYGGVVPEVAARSHIEVMIPTIDEALIQAFSQESRSGNLESGIRKLATGNRRRETSFPQLPTPNSQIPNVDPWSNIDAIAVSRGPGLGGSLMIGVLTARTLALIKDKPLYGVDHVHSHVYANFVDWSKLDKSHGSRWSVPKFPLLALIVSGGHTQLVWFKNHFDYQLLGQTQDDAAGEAFDKVAKIVGLPYPGGPSIQAAAINGNPAFFKLPKAKMQNPYDFSFSGLKTAVLRAVQQLVGVDYDFPSTKLAKKLSGAQVNDIAASFQHTAVEILVDKTLKAYQEFKPRTVVIAGGVAANSELRQQLDERIPAGISYAPINLCLDNAVMTASLGFYASQFRQPDDLLKLEIDPSLAM